MRIISTKGHGPVDYVVGVLLIAAPWIFWYSDQDTNVWLPMVLIGMSEIVVAAMSDPWPKEPDARRREERLVHRTA